MHCHHTVERVPRQLPRGQGLERLMHEALPLHRAERVEGAGDDEDLGRVRSDCFCGALMVPAPPNGAKGPELRRMRIQQVAYRHRFHARGRVAEADSEPLQVPWVLKAFGAVETGSQAVCFAQGLQRLTRASRKPSRKN